MLIHILGKPFTAPPIPNILLTLASHLLVLALSEPRLILLTFPLRPNMFRFGHRNNLLIQQRLVLLWGLQLVEGGLEGGLGLFVNWFVGGAQGVDFWLLGGGLGETWTFVQTAFVDRAVCGFAQQVGGVKMLFSLLNLLASTIRRLLTPNDRLARHNGALQRLNKPLLALLHILPILFVIMFLHKLINQLSVLLERKFPIIIDWNSNPTISRDYFLLVVEFA